MLKIECPECKEWLRSNLLLEKKVTTCPSCHAEVDVGEIYISAGSYSISRDVLRKHFFKYKRLLLEAFKELEEIKSESEGSRAYTVTEESISSFISNLKEMLSGCREGHRVFPRNMSVGFTCEDRRYESELENISKTGLCLRLKEGQAVPARGSVASLKIEEPDLELETTGTVVWMRDGGLLGVRFGELDKETGASLVSFIESVE